MISCLPRTLCKYFPELLEKCVQSVYNGIMSDVVREKLKLLPDNPGVYIMLDQDGTIIYVGKARNLKNRVRQYFHSSAKPVKVQAMVECIADFSYIVTPSEVDALALENTYIKKYKPKYNILLKDDKTYPYVKVTREEYPRIAITRKVRRGDGKYFGPFMAGIAAKDVVEIAIDDGTEIKNAGTYSRKLSLSGADAGNYVAEVYVATLEVLPYKTEISVGETEYVYTYGDAKTAISPSSGRVAMASAASAVASLSASSQRSRVRSVTRSCSTST